jgi:hypothetical protein
MYVVFQVPGTTRVIISSGSHNRLATWPCVVSARSFSRVTLLNDRQEMMYARPSETNASSSTVFCQNKCNLRNLYKQEIPALTVLHWFPTSHQDVKLARTTSFLFLPRRSILHPFFLFFRIAGSIIHQNYGHMQGLPATNDWYVSTKFCICHAR